MKKDKEPNESEEIDIEEGLIRSYWFNDEIVEKTYAKIKGILIILSDLSVYNLKVL